MGAANSACIQLDWPARSLQTEYLEKIGLKSLDRGPWRAAGFLSFFENPTKPSIFVIWRVEKQRDEVKSEDEVESEERRFTCAKC